jgi:hypothetical protein
MPTGRPIIVGENREIGLDDVVQREFDEVFLA